MAYQRDYSRPNVSSIAFEAEGWADGNDNTYVHIASGYTVDREELHRWSQRFFFDLTDELLAEMQQAENLTPETLEFLVLMAKLALTH